MKQILLAAGYATRLAPLTDSTPKPLLPVGGTPMIEHLLASTATIGGIDQTCIVTNHKFAPQFSAWLENYKQNHPDFHGAIIDDGTTANENRLGAIGDLRYVLQNQAIDDDLLVIAADNLFTTPLTAFGLRIRETATPTLGIYELGDLDAAKNFGVVSIDKNGVLTDFTEKSENPTSSLIAIALYYYPRAVLPEIFRYLDEGNNPDQPGRLIQWLFPKMPVFTWNVPGKWLDVGSHESLAEVSSLFDLS